MDHDQAAHKRPLVDHVSTVCFRLMGRGFLAADSALAFAQSPVSTFIELYYRRTILVISLPYIDMAFFGIFRSARNGLRDE